MRLSALFCFPDVPTAFATAPAVLTPLLTHFIAPSAFYLWAVLGSASSLFPPGEQLLALPASGLFPFTEQLLALPASSLFPPRAQSLALLPVRAVLAQHLSSFH